MNGRPPAWAAGALVLLALAAGALFWRRAVTPAPQPPAAPAPAAPPPAAAPAPSPSPAPPAALDGSDDRVRDEASTLSSNALWRRWLRQTDLARRAVAALAMMADGKTPASALDFMAPGRPFRAVARDGKAYADPRSFARYDAVAAAVASIDAARAASVYRNLRPLFQQACAELESCDADAMLSKAISRLLAAPVPSGSPELREKGLVYRYADDSLERLSPVQKQLLRMGPRNEKRVQDKLRELAAALGLPRS